jgi:hypothetical protein
VDSFSHIEVLEKGFPETGFVSSDRVIANGQIGDAVNTIGACLDDLGQAGIYIFYGDHSLRHGCSRWIGNRPPDGAAILCQRSGGDRKEDLWTG